MYTYYIFTLLALFMVNNWRTEIIPVQEAQEDVAADEWVLFESQFRDGQVYLRWQTELAKRPKGFEIERSSDGESYEPIGKVSGKTRSNKQQYRYRDVLPLPGQLYYRLRLVNAAGESSYSEIITVENPADPTPEFFVKSTGMAFTTYFPASTEGRTVVRMLDEEGLVAYEEELPEGLQSWGLLWEEDLNEPKYLLQIVLRGKTFYQWVEKDNS